MASMPAHVVDVKGAFLHGEFEDGEIIHMKIPQGFEKHFPEGCVLLLKKCLYGLKQAAKALFGDSCCALQVPWHSNKARRIPALTVNGWMDGLS